MDFFDKPENVHSVRRKASPGLSNGVKILKILSYICLAIIVAVDFFISREHVYFPWERVPGFYALFGLIACILIIVIAKTLGKKWLMKKEDYYG